jgi:uncharacterized protein
MANHKILFAGPVGAGKTTAIETVSDIPPVRTDVRASDEVRQRKDSTTVAIDYGILRLPDGDKIHLYGTPGQDRFDFMWELTTQGALGLVLLVDNARPDPTAVLTTFVDHFADFVSETGLVVGVTHTDHYPLPDLDEHRAALSSKGLNPPVFTVDARERADVALLLEALLFTLDPELDEPVR